VAACWDSGEEISDDEDSESSDEDFELLMATNTDTDNDDITMLQAEILDEEERDDDLAYLSTIFVPIQ
jgi:hypothetical protein